MNEELRRATLGELLTAREAALRLKLSLGAFYKLRRRQHIPSRGIGRRLLFAPADLVRDPQPKAAVIDFKELARKHARGERLHA